MHHLSRFPHSGQKDFKCPVLLLDVTPGFPALHNQPHPLTLSETEKVFDSMSFCQSKQNLELHEHPCSFFAVTFIVCL